MPFPFGNFIVIPNNNNVRRHPYAQNKIATTNGQTLIADATAPWSWTVGTQYLTAPSTAGDPLKAGRWMIKGNLE